MFGDVFFVRTTLVCHLSLSPFMKLFVLSGSSVGDNSDRQEVFMMWRVAIFEVLKAAAPNRLRKK